jgi:hypothetical protein
LAYWVKGFVRRWEAKTGAVGGQRSCDFVLTFV